MAEYNKSEWIVVGVSGVTCGGKTTLANRLRRLLRPVWVFNQDQYFYPDDSPRHVRCGDLDHNNYDILSALDMAAMRRDVLGALGGGGGAPAEDGAPDEGGVVAPGRKFLVIEGFTVLNYKPIADLCDLKYYLTLDLGTCAARRALRVYSPPDVPGYFELCVWPEHLKYKKEMQRDRTVRFLSGADPDVLQRVLADLRQLVGGTSGGGGGGSPGHSAGNCNPPCDTGGTPAEAGHTGGPSPAASGSPAGRPKQSDRKPPGCDAGTCLLDKSCGKDVYP